MNDLDNFVLPPRQKNLTAWLGRDLVNHPTRWITKLSSDHITELKDAMVRVLTSGLELKEISREVFPLPSLGPILLGLQQELLHGLGFVLIRGLKREEFTEKEMGIIFFGLGSYFGHARSHNAAG